MNNSLLAGSWGRGAVLAMILVAGALGFCCLFDADHHDGSSPELCLTVLSVSSPPALLSGLLPLGWAAGGAVLPIRSAWVTVLTPPPRSL
jgi:hypothetical protein